MPKKPVHSPSSPAQSGLWLSKAGDWYHDGTPVRHARLCALLTRSIGRDEHHELIVTTGRDRLPFVAEDAPILVRTVEITSTELVLRLSTEAAERLTCESHVTIDAVGRIRSVVSDGRFWALWTRSATQVLLDRIDDSGTSIQLPCGRLALHEANTTLDWSLLPVPIATKAYAPA